MPTRRTAKSLSKKQRPSAPTAPSGYVMVPLTEYERLVAHQMAQEVIAAGEPPEFDYIDIEDADALFAARRLTRVRRKKGLTQAQLGRLVGLPQSQISRVERNPDRTTIRTLKKIARAMGVNLAAIL